jgi:hypothetical protein
LGQSDNFSAAAANKPPLQDVSGYIWKFYYSGKLLEIITHIERHAQFANNWQLWHCEFLEIHFVLVELLVPKNISPFDTTLDQEELRVENHKGCAGVDHTNTPKNMSCSLCTFV